MNLISNLSPKTLTFSATVVGYLLIDDMTASEQNALGNWLMLTAQVLCTNAYFKQLNNERNDQTNNNVNELNMLKKMVKALNKEIENLKSNNQ